MTQLVKGFTNEELWQKAEYEGIEYLLLNYLYISDTGIGIKNEP